MIELLVRSVLVVNECNGKECGTPCSEGICDKNGYCTSPEYNPCAVHGCDGKKCGETCLQGDIAGVCDPYGDCNFDVASVIDGGQCGTSNMYQIKVSNDDVIKRS